MKSKFHSETILEELETRQLFSGGVEGIVVENNEQTEAVHMEMEANTEQNQTEDGNSVVTDIADNLTHELVFIDSGVENYEQLLNDILSQSDNEEKNIEVIVLDDQRDGIEQISETLANFKNLDAVHLISHGSDGNIEIGNEQLNSDTLNQNLSEISGWADAFSEQGDFLIYGCNLAESEDGQSLVQSLSSLTHTDVAASDDLTGHKSLGGDWELEYSTGTIETDIAVSAESQQSWNAVLAETTYESNTTVNNDEELKSNANWGQTFNHTSGNGTYTVNQISLELYKDAGAISQNITVTLSATWNGPSLGSATISSDVLTTSYNSYDFDFTDVDLTDGATYYIKITTDTNSGDVYAGGDNAGSYANGDKINHGGNPLAGKDIAFAIKHTDGDTAAVIGGDISFSGNEGDTVSGTLIATDAEGLTDNTYFSVSSQPTNGIATIDAATGDWSFTPTDINWFGNDSFAVTVTDDLGGTTTQVINITLANVNDAATVSSATVTLTETDAALTSSGTLTSTDVDNPDNTFTANTIVGTTGTFNINAAGSWTFTANSAYDSLNSGDSVNETFNLTSIDGTVSTVQITINGTNDSSTVSSAAVTLTETDSALTSSGTLTSTDVDNPDNTFTANTIVGTTGTFNINAAGSWTFTANSAYDSLNSGDSVNETFNLTSIDGTSSAVQITINGTEEATTINTTIIEIENQTTSKTEIDNSDNTLAPNITEGAIGDFSSNIHSNDNNTDGIILKTTFDTKSDDKSETHTSSKTGSQSPSSINDSTPNENTNGTESNVDYTYTSSDDANYETEKYKTNHQSQLQLFALDKVNSQVNNDENLFELSNSSDDENLLNNIDLMRDQMSTDHDQFEKQDVEIEIIMGATVSVTAGFVNWVLRGSALLTSLLSSASLFKQFDPLPVVFNNTNGTDKSDKTSQDKEQNKVEEMFDK